MAGVALPGIGSGLDTGSIVSQLMQLEARPQQMLKSRVSTGERAVSALQGINTKVLALKAAAEKLSVPRTGTPPDTNTGAAWSSVKATSSSSAVAVSTSASSQPTHLRFSVQSLADAYFVATSAVAAGDPVVDGPPPSLTIHTADGNTTTINPSDRSIAAVVSAINAAGAGVRAAAIPQGDGTSRLQITSTTTGSAGGFSIISGLSAPIDFTHQGSDAVLDFGSGLTATSSSNTFADLIPGTSVTVGKVEDNVSINVAPDTEAPGAAAQALVDSVNAVLADIRTRTTSTPGFGGEAGTSGPLVGDSTMRSLTMALSSAISSTGVSPSEAGVSITRDGTYQFDAAKFNDLLAKDPARAESLVAGLAARLGDVAEAASNSTSGSITTAITNRQSQIKSLNTQVDAWDNRLALREAALQRQFSALDVAMAKLNAQSGWLTSQINSLPTISTSNND